MKPALILCLSCLAGCAMNQAHVYKPDATELARWDALEAADCITHENHNSLILGEMDTAWMEGQANR